MKSFYKIFFLICALNISNLWAQLNPPSNVIAKAYELHVDISWDLVTGANVVRYNIYKKENEEYKPIGYTSSGERFFIDFVDETGVANSYKVSYVDNNSVESSLSEEVTATTVSMTDEEYLTMVQESTFRYFWDFAHPVSGLSRERSNSSGETVTSGGSGFGIMALLVGIERNFITREQGIDRLLKILDFLKNKAIRYHGAWSHWINGTTGYTIPFSQKDDGGDLVETSFLIQGLLTARQYFNNSTEKENQIRDLITELWEGVDWNWYRKFDFSPYLYWHWSPTYGWQMNHRIIGYNETLITYLLAIASPTHPIPAYTYKEGWASGDYVNGQTFYGYKLDIGKDYGGPLFFAHYSFLGFDPRDKRDAYTNYFKFNRNHTLVNRAYCEQNPKGFIGYSSNVWGLTASDDPFGYRAHQPYSDNDNGTITPTAAVSSIVYTPEESIAAIKYFYKNFGEKLWGIYGFRDAFNLSQNWYAPSYIAIDQGPIICMIENYRSELLWNNFMANPEIQPMMDSVGFVEDVTSIKESGEIPNEFKLYNNYPNPFNPSTIISFTISTPPSLAPLGKGRDGVGFVYLAVFDVLGNEISVLIDNKKLTGYHEVEFNGTNLPSGIYFYRLQVDNHSITKKMVLIK